MGVFDSLISLVGNWWFPFVIGAMSGINMFTIVLSGPTAALFVSTVLAQPKNWLRVAVINAVGTIIGVVGVVYFVNFKGTDYIKDLNPKIFESSTWEKTSGLMTDYGPYGTVLASAMPVVLHPIILFGMLAGMDNTVLVVTILIGRVIKYCIMANLALTAPKALRFFGVNTDKLGLTAEKGKAAKKAE
jgi:membrane protein YqaA with SNARE-associated domain